MTTPNTIPTAPAPDTAIPAQAMPARSSLSCGLPILKFAVVKRHALTCSAALRRGKFTRVGRSFFDEVQAEFDTVLRQFALPLTDDTPSPETPTGLLTCSLRNKVIAAAETLAARLIERKVRRHPHKGRTLMAIRG